jgi:hypothetical protein
MQSAPETTATDPSPSPAQSAASAPEAGLGTSVQPALRVDPPPSARLNYRIQATKQDQSIFGSGYINWLNNDSSFTIDGESSLLFISVLRWFHVFGCWVPAAYVFPWTSKVGRTLASYGYFDAARSKIIINFTEIQGSPLDGVGNRAH